MNGHAEDHIKIDSWIWRTVVGVFLLVIADIAAVWLWLTQPAWISFSFHSKQLYELFGFTNTLALVALAVLGVPLCRRVRDYYVPLFVFLATACFFLSILVPLCEPTYDYECWMNGMISNLKYHHPYSLEAKPSYWFPPLMAQSLTLGYRLLSALFPGAPGVPGVSGIANTLLFYAFECVQYLMVLVVFWLTYFLGRDLGLNRRWAAGMAGFLMVFNVPLFRLLLFQQPNLWLVASILTILLMRDRSPCLAGLALALGFHIKLYPAILGLPLLLTWRWRVLLWAGVFASAIFLVQTGGTNFRVWTAFLEQIVQPRWGSFYRDNSLHSVAKNSLKPFDLVSYDEILTYGLELLAVGWMVYRLAKREILARNALRDPSTDRSWIQSFRFGEQFVDTVAMSFFVSPVVFEHHYVMTIPVILWTAVIWGERSPGRVLIGSLLILVVPIIDVCPFGWNRIAGLLVLLAARPVQLIPRRPAWPPGGCLVHDIE